MEVIESTLTSPADALEIMTYRWETAADRPLGVVQIAHGVAEYGLRYERLATALTDAGYTVVTSDHRGHGKSVNDGIVLGSFGAPGWAGLIQDLVAVSESIRDDHPDFPFFIVGHSMGSFAVQQVILDHSDLFSGVVLSGSTALDMLAQAMAAGGGGDLTAFNAAFEPRTGFEWLSRDEAEVDKYVADPLCGFDLDEAMIPQLFSEAARLGDPGALAGIRKDLPMLLVSGQADPLSGGQLVALLAQRYRDAGLTHVTLQVYPEARHEVFNETNRDEVTALVVDWLRRHTA
jgi:alpha-beta hydrolase superfamily lysophospholipase